MTEMCFRDGAKLQNARRRNLWPYLRRYIDHALREVKCPKYRSVSDYLSLWVKKDVSLPASVAFSQQTVCPPFCPMATWRTWARELRWQRPTLSEFVICTTVVCTVRSVCLLTILYTGTNSRKVTFTLYWVFTESFTEHFQFYPRWSDQKLSRQSKSSISFSCHEQTWPRRATSSDAPMAKTCFFFVLPYHPVSPQMPQRRCPKRKATLLIRRRRRRRIHSCTCLFTMWTLLWPPAKVMVLPTNQRKATQSPLPIHRSYCTT